MVEIAFLQEKKAKYIQFLADKHLSRVHLWRPCEESAKQELGEPL
jgi:hypothetical protein